MTTDTEFWELSAPSIARYGNEKARQPEKEWKHNGFFYVKKKTQQLVLCRKGKRHLKERKKPNILLKTSLTPRRL